MGGGKEGENERMEGRRRERKGGREGGRNFPGRVEEGKERERVLTTCQVMTKCN